MKEKEKRKDTPAIEPSGNGREKRARKNPMVPQLFSEAQIRESLERARSDGMLNRYNFFLA